MLLELLERALGKVEGRRCVRECLAAAQRSSGAPIWVAAVGKAASSMALGAWDALGPALERALVITKDAHVSPELAGLPGIEILESAHPVPDARSLAAGERLLQWVETLPAHIEPLFLLSGGASSLVEVLEPGVSLKDLEHLTAAWLAEGIDIGELNARRARISRIKGGRLTVRLAGRAGRALLLSDVPGNDPAVLGSGLLAPAAQGPDALERVLVADVEQALAGAAAAARALGLTASILPGRFAGDAEQVAQQFTQAMSVSRAQVCLWGGESTVRLPAHPGRGGRNQHLALAAARLLAGTSDRMLLAAGSDGTDGPTPESGALVDGDTWAQVVRAGLDPEACLARADSGTALAAAGALLHSGPTGTNVGDLVLGLKGTA